MEENKSSHTQEEHKASSANENQTKKPNKNRNTNRRNKKPKNPDLEGKDKTGNPPKHKKFERKEFSQRNEDEESGDGRKQRNPNYHKKKKEFGPSHSTNETNTSKPFHKRKNWNRNKKQPSNESGDGPIVDSNDSSKPFQKRKNFDRNKKQQKFKKDNHVDGDSHEKETVKKKWNKKKAQQRNDDNSKNEQKNTKKKNRNRNRKRKNVYTNYMSKQEIDDGVKDGSIVIGALFVHKIPYRVYCVLEGARDILIQGYPNINRAYHGDTVAVKIIPPPEKKEKKKEKDKDKDDTDTEDDIIDDKNNSETEEEEEDDEEEEEEPRRYGTVVGIIKKDHPDELMGVCVGRMFHPLNERYPWMQINSRGLPPGEPTKNFLVAKIKPQWGLEFRYPQCTINTIMEDIDNFDTQYLALKTKNNIGHSEEFDESVLVGLPLSGWEIPKDEIDKRLDLREELIFSIDPPTARDLDDALSCKLLDNGNYKVGVHIADVSYFVEYESPLDLEARKRGNTVYFVTENIPMLPRILCDELCSLQSNVDRLAFSVIWELTPDGERISEEFHRTIIRTSDQLDYATAHKMIQNPEEFESTLKLKQCALAVNQLNSIAKKLSEKRYASGSLALDSAEIHFDFDDDGNVIGVSPYERYDSHFLIEEFMLLANIAVAEKLHDTCKNGILLRRHPKPDSKKLDEFMEQCKTLNLFVDCTSSKTLHESIQNIKDEYNGITMEAILCMASTPMQSALYCSTSESLPDETYHHYALNFPLYCHFTSPIRRYPDLITHRQLAAAITNQPQYIKPDIIESISTHCNDTKRDADYASRDCDRLYLNQYLRTKIFIEKGIIVSLSKQNFTVLVPDYEIKKQINTKTDEYTSNWVKTSNELIITWNEEKNNNNDENNNNDKNDDNDDKNITKQPPQKLVLKLLSVIDVQLLHTNENFCQTIGLKLVRPTSN